MIDQNKHMYDLLAKLAKEPTIVDDDSEKLAARTLAYYAEWAQNIINGLDGGK